MSLADWPALSGWNLDRSQPGLRTERAVWGKVQGIGAGFRWIARSLGFGRDPGGEAPDLERRLRAGSEDRPRRACAWRVLPGRYLAVVFYPSRARDAAGRGEMLERQILEWRPVLGLPPALAALALLPEAAILDDDVWWGRQLAAPWTDPAFSLPIAPGDCPSIELDPGRIGQTLESGIAELAARVGPEALRDLYADLIAGTRPALLRGLDGPLGPEALAALLVPLPPPLAERLSLLGWVPGARLEPADLASSWDLAVAGRQAQDLGDPSRSPPALGFRQPRRGPWPGRAARGRLIGARSGAARRAGSPTPASGTRLGARAGPDRRPARRARRLRRRPRAALPGSGAAAPPAARRPPAAPRAGRTRGSPLMSLGRPRRRRTPGAGRSPPTGNSRSTSCAPALFISCLTPKPWPGSDCLGTPIAPRSCSP